MKKIIVMAGSNSSQSINRKLATYASRQMQDVEVLPIDLNETVLPLYDPDLEKEKGIPAEVTKIDSMLESADGIILSLAEYNGSYSAAFKNAFDWLSRINMKVWKQKPMLLMATSIGKGGAKHVLATAKSGFPHFGGDIVATFSLPSFQQNFQSDEITDAELKTEFSKAIELFQNSLSD